MRRQLSVPLVCDRTGSKISKTAQIVVGVFVSLVRAGFGWHGGKPSLPMLSFY